MLDSKRRFVWLLTLLLTTGFISTTLISYWVAHKSLSEQVSESTLPLTSDNVYSEIQRDLLRPVFISSIMAQDTFVRDWVISGENNPEKMTRYLKEIQQRYKTVTSFFVSNSTHNYYHPKGILKRVAQDSDDDQWYFRTLNLPEDKHYEINIDTDTADRNSTTVFVNYRVYNYAGEVIGVIGVGLAIDMVKNLIEDYQHRFERHVYFIDQHGDITVHERQFNEERSIHQQPGLSSIAADILNSSGGSFTYKRNGKRIYLNSRQIPEFQWHLIVEQSSDVAEQRIFNTLLINLLLSLVIMAIVFFFINMMVERYQHRLKKMATTDKLTGAANREMFEMLLEQSIKSSNRNDSLLSIIMLDIDHFKTVNDQYGHLIGDQVLQNIAYTITEQIRNADTLCRWGGEEFVILLPDCDLGHASDLAEKIRISIENSIMYISAIKINITASFGVSEYIIKESTTEILQRADKALYQAKDLGRNRVVI